MHGFLVKMSEHECYANEWHMQVPVWGTLPDHWLLHQALENAIPEGEEQWNGKQEGHD